MSIADVEKYWSAGPCNIRHSQVSIEDDPLDYSRQVTGRKLYVEPHIRAHAGFRQWDNEKVLDLGCGIGTQAIEFMKYGADVTAVDISTESLEIARKRAVAEGLDPYIFFKADIENLLNPDTDYDLVYSFGVIHHTPHPEEAVKQAYKVLKEGGEFRLMVYNRYSWKALWIILTYGKGQFWRWKELIPQHSEAQTGCPITFTYTKKEIKELLESAGFTVEQMWVDHIFPYKIAEYKEYSYVLEWHWRILPKRMFRWLEKHFGWHLMVIARK